MPNQYGTATRHSTIIGVCAAPTKNNGPDVTSFSNPPRSSWERSHLTTVRFTRCSSPSHRLEPAEQVPSGVQIAMRPGISSLPSSALGRAVVLQPVVRRMFYAQAESVEETTPHHAQSNLPIFPRTPPVPFQLSLRTTQPPSCSAPSCTLEGEEFKLCRSL